MLEKGCALRNATIFLPTYLTLGSETLSCSLSAYGYGIEGTDTPPPCSTERKENVSL